MSFLYFDLRDGERNRAITTHQRDECGPAMCHVWPCGPVQHVRRLVMGAVEQTTLTKTAGLGVEVIVEAHHVLTLKFSIEHERDGSEEAVEIQRIFVVDAVGGELVVCGHDPVVPHGQSQ